MTTEKLNDLKALRHWVFEVLKSVDGLDKALDEEALTNEAFLAAYAESRYEFIHTSLDRMIAENEPVTKEQAIEEKHEANNNH